MIDGMECGCQEDACAYAEDAEPFSFKRTKMRRARKQHTCSECSGIIGKGVMYEDMFAVMAYGGKMCNKTCIGCYYLAKDMMCGCRVYGGLRDYVINSLDVDIYSGP